MSDWRDCVKAAFEQIDKLRQELAAARAQLARGVAHARERVGLVQDLEDCRTLLREAMDAYEHESVGQIACNFRDVSLTKKWYERAKAAGGWGVNVECSHGRAGWCPLCRIVELGQELAAAQARLADIANAVTFASEEGCGDERHCACVPLLRVELAAARAECNEANRRLTEITEELYGQGFDIVGWHLNGEVEPLDSWFDDNEWSAVPVGWRAAGGGE